MSSSKVSNRIPKNIKIANQRKTEQGQFQYLGRWVDKDQFRAYLYNDKDEQKLANSYQEFETLTTSGLWFDKKPEKQDKPEKCDIPDSKERKPKNDTIRSTS